MIKLQITLENHTYFVVLIHYGYTSSVE